MQGCYHALDAMHLTGGWTCFLLYFNTSVFWMFEEVVCVRFFFFVRGWLWSCDSRLMLSSRSTLNAMVVTSYWVEVEYLLLRWFEWSLLLSSFKKKKSAPFYAWALRWRCPWAKQCGYTKTWHGFATANCIALGIKYFSMIYPGCLKWKYGQVWSIQYCRAAVPFCNFGGNNRDDDFWRQRQHQ